MPAPLCASYSITVPSSGQGLGGVTCLCLCLTNGCNVLGLPCLHAALLPLRLLLRPGQPHLAVDQSRHHNFFPDTPGTAGSSLMHTSCLLAVVGHNPPVSWGTALQGL